MENFQVEYKKKYGPMWDAMQPISDMLQNTLETLCQRNNWLQRRGVVSQTDPGLDSSSPYSFCTIDDLSMLKLFFEHGNWSLRQGVVYKDLFFCNQVSGGDEWWTCKLDHKFGTYVPLKTISMRTVVLKENFESLIENLLSTEVTASNDDTKTQEGDIQMDEKKNTNTANQLIYSRDEAVLILELFENLLDEHGIKIPSPEDDERDEGSGALYGSPYSNLLDEVEESIISIVRRARKPRTPLVKYEFSGDM